MSANLDTVWESFMKGGSPSSYQGRIRSRRVMDQLSKKVAYNHAYRPTNAKSLSQFLRLKQEDAIKNSTAAPSYSASNGSNPNWTSKIMDEEANDLLQKLQEQASGQYLQNFYNAYMSPANSDICYRLGNVTRTKHNA